MVELRILGPPQLLAEGAEAETLSRQPKRAALLAYLAAATPQGFHRRDKLLALFWPELDARHARNSLSQALHLLRAALGPGAILTRGEGEVGVDPDVVWCDAVAFETALHARRSADALALYRGDLLDGMFIAGAPEFERWLDEARNHLRQRASEGAWALAEEAAGAGEAIEAERWARRAADLLPPDETAGRRLIRFLHGLGDRAAAVRAYERLAETLAREYDIEPSAETRALAAAIREDDRTAPVPSLPPPAPADVAREPTAPAGVAVAEDAAGSTRWDRRPTATPVRRRSGRRLLLAAAAGVTLMVLVVHLAGAGSGPAGTATAPAPRILVLPFENLGGPEDGYFASGLADEITARLAIRGGVDVLGGSAFMRYRDALATPARIRREIDADYILDGTVTWQRSADAPGRVRVRPRLIDARSEAAVWAAVLDHDLDDLAGLFALLSGIADRVVQELHVAVEEPERATAGAAPTPSLEAYDAYLRGRDFKMRSWSVADTRASIEMLERAVRLDPQFALAHAWLAFAHTEAFWLNGLSPDHLGRAREAAEAALRLDPALPDAHTSIGHLHYVCCEDYDRALAHLERSHAGRPGDAQVVMFIGNIHKRQGRWDDAFAYYGRAAALDPRWESPFLNIAQMELWRRRYDEVERATDRVFATNPQPAFAWSMRAWVPLLRDGDTKGARRVLDRAAAVSESFTSIRLPFYLAVLERDYSAAWTLAARRNHAGEAFDDWLDSEHLRRAVVQHLRGDSAGARIHFDSARAQLEQELRNAFPGSRRMQNLLRSALAIAYAGSGRRAEALEHAELVRDAEPARVDAISGPGALQNVALTYTLLGERDAALDMLEELLRMPARISPALLRVDPLWDPLRGDRRFRRLVASRG